MFGIKTKKRRISEDCWNLDYSFILWLNEHLVVYKKEAIKKVDLEFHKIKYKDEEYTLLELIDIMTELTYYLIKDEEYFCWEDNTLAKINELLDLFKVSFPYLWW